MTEKRVGWWLLACCGLVLCILAEGGATRLTHSGLSITQWKPVTGVVPPLTRAQWEAELARYAATPEYEQENVGMSVSQFKSIYWWEYAHRLLARAAGLFFLLPFLYFAAKRRFERSLFPKLAGIAALWGLQGALGWFMVASGLVRQPRVSHLRLTAHLLTACTLYSLMLWTALGLLLPRRPGAPPAPAGLRRLSTMLAALAFVTIGSGGLVAGLRAGFFYNTFPKMAGYWLPPFLFPLKPWPRSALDDALTAQFDHRVLALTLAAGAALLWALTRRAPLEPRAKRAASLLLAAVGLQAALGIATLLLAVPVPLGVAHQANALLVLGAALFARRELGAAAQLPR